MTYTYYPGCSLHATGVAYDKSTRAVFDRLDIELQELEDWNCCGATSYTSVKKTVAYAISARNLALAEKTGHDIVAPCSACFYVLNKTRSRMAAQPELRAQVDTALAEAGLKTDLSVPVRKPLEVLINDYGLDWIAARQTNSISGFKIACYYGCQIVRPYGAIDEDPENPVSMERLFEALGAECIDYPPKVRCCGGMLIATFEEVAVQLCEDLVDWAVRGGANCIVTVCPLCQANLDLLNLSGKGDRPKIPVLYFTQVVGLALGCTPEEVGLEHGLVPVDIPAPPLEGRAGGVPVSAGGGAA
jgi:heterodisulfide reductase subunit B